MQHIFIAEIDGKEIDMTTMMQEEKQKAVDFGRLSMDPDMQAG